MQNTPLGLGGVERSPDERDYQLLGSTVPVSRPAVFMQDLSSLPVEMQNKLPACGSHAGSFLKNIQETKEKGSPQRFSPRYTWIKVKQIDGYSPEDGTDMRSIMKSLASDGVLDFPLLGNDTTLDLTDYTSKAVVTPDMDANAQPKITLSYGFIDRPSMEQIKQSIYQYGAVLALLTVGDGMWIPSWAEKDILPLKLGNRVGGHFVVLHSYDEQYVYFRNSWSDAWGKKGDGYFNASYIPYVLEIGTAVDANDETIAKEIQEIADLKKQIAEKVHNPLA